MDEIDRIMKKAELGFELEDWEKWIYKVLYVRSEGD